MCSESVRPALPGVCLDQLLFRPRKGGQAASLGLRLSQSEILGGPIMWMGLFAHIVGTVFEIGITESALQSPDGCPVALPGRTRRGGMSRAMGCWASRMSLFRINVRSGECSRLRLWCPCCAFDLPQWRAFGQGVLADGVSVDAQLAGDRPEGESPELGLLHILPKSPLASGTYSMLLRPGFARPQVPVHLACFQCRQVGVAPVSSAVDATGQRGAFRRVGRTILLGLYTKLLIESWQEAIQGLVGLRDGCGPSQCKPEATDRRREDSRRG